MNDSAGTQDHIQFRNAEVCRACEDRICVRMCSGHAIARDDGGLPVFDRRKCVLCGACLWNCPEIEEDRQANLIFGPGA